MDLFEYILETMNYNLYTDEYWFENILTEDMITEAVDIRKLGSAIKKYVDKFLQWIFKKARELFKFIKSKFVKNNKDKEFVKNNKDYGNELFDKDEVNEYYNGILQERQNDLEKGKESKSDNIDYYLVCFFYQVTHSMGIVEDLSAKGQFARTFETISKEKANELYAHLLFLKNEAPQIVRNFNVSNVKKIFGVDETMAKKVVEEGKPTINNYFENTKLIDRAFIELRKISNRSKDKMDKNVTKIQYRSYDEKEIIYDVTICFDVIYAYHKYVVDAYTESLNTGNADRIDYIKKTRSDDLEKCDHYIEKFFKTEYKIYTFEERVSSDDKMSTRFEEVNRAEAKFLHELDIIKKMSIPYVKSNSNEQGAKFYGNEIRRVITMYTKVMNRMNKLCRYYERIENDKKKEE